MSQGHPGAIYIHQSAQYVVESLSEDERVILLNRATPDFYTRAIRNHRGASARRTGARTLRGRPRREPRRKFRHRSHDAPRPGSGHQSGDRLKRSRSTAASTWATSRCPCPPEVLITEAVWFTFEPATSSGPGDRRGRPRHPARRRARRHRATAAHPRPATVGDLGGLSTLLHVDTGQPTIFVYDATPGGAGISERGFNTVQRWLSAALEAIESCGCDSGCPSCVHSPKCGNRNEPLSKAGAMALLRGHAEEHRRKRRYGRRGGFGITVEV